MTTMTNEQRLNRARRDIQVLALVRDMPALRAIYQDVAAHVLSDDMIDMNKRLAMLEGANRGMARKLYGDDSAGWVERLRKPHPGEVKGGGE